jgi:hypothetical protein
VSAGTDVTCDIPRDMSRDGHADYGSVHRNLVAYVTVSGCPWPEVIGADSWAGLGEWLTGPEFAAMADGVLDITVIDRLLPVLQASAVAR